MLKYAGVTIDFANKCIRSRLGPDIWESVPIDFQSMGMERTSGPTIIEAPDNIPEEEQQMSIEDISKVEPQAPQLAPSKSAFLPPPEPAFLPPSATTSLPTESNLSLLDYDFYSDPEYDSLPSTYDTMDEDGSELSAFREVVGDLNIDDKDNEEFKDYHPSFEARQHKAAFGEDHPNRGYQHDMYAKFNERYRGLQEPEILPLVRCYNTPPDFLYKSNKEGSIYNQTYGLSTYNESGGHTTCIPFSNSSHSWKYLSDGPPGELYAYIAAISRTRDDFMLDREIFQRLDAKFGPHDVDACASVDGGNSQIPT